MINIEYYDILTIDNREYVVISILDVISNNYYYLREIDKDETPLDNFIIVMKPAADTIDSLVEIPVNELDSDIFDLLLSNIEEEKNMN